MRVVFAITSFIVLCAYCSKALCFIDPEFSEQLSIEQKGAMALSALLLLFNDPIYMAHLYYPSFATFAITELCSSLFVSGLLVFWLRELAGYRPRKAEANWSSLKKLIFTCSGVNKCAIAYLITLFFILTINFMVLNCFYYIYVMGDPSLAGKFNNLRSGSSK